MNKQTMFFGMVQADLKSANDQLTARQKGIDTPLEPIIHNISRAFEKVDELKNGFYTLSSDELTAFVKAAFQYGWRMRMNRKNSECEETMDNCLTLMFLEIDKALGKISNESISEEKGG